MKIKNPETGEVIVIPQGMEDAVRDAIESGNDPMEAMQMKYGGIHINPANKGKFNATKKATGKTTEELTHSKNPLTRKRAIFAQNASRWKHQDGGQAMQQQQPQGGGQEDQMQQLVQMAEQALAQGASPEEVAQMLIQQGVPEQVVQQVIQYAIQDLQQQQQAQGQNPQEEAQEQMQQQNPQEEQAEMAYGGDLGYRSNQMALNSTMSPAFSKSDELAYYKYLNNINNNIYLPIEDSPDSKKSFLLSNVKNAYTSLTDKYNEGDAPSQRFIQKGYGGMSMYDDGGMAMYSHGGMSMYEEGGMSMYGNGGQLPESLLRTRMRASGATSEEINNYLTENYNYGGMTMYGHGGMIKRADGSYSKRGLWDNIRANKGSGKAPTKEMLEQESKIRAREAAYGGAYGNGGGIDNPGFRALPDYVQQDIINNMRTGGKFLRKAENGIRDNRVSRRAAPLFPDGPVLENNNSFATNPSLGNRTNTPGSMASPIGTYSTDNQPFGAPTNIDNGMSSMGSSGVGGSSIGGSNIGNNVGSNNSNNVGGMGSGIFGMSNNTFGGIGSGNNMGSAPGGSMGSGAPFWSGTGGGNNTPLYGPENQPAPFWGVSQTNGAATAATTPSGNTKLSSFDKYNKGLSNITGGNSYFGRGIQHLGQATFDFTKGGLEMAGANISNRNALGDEANNLRSAMRNDYKKVGKRPTDGNSILQKYGGKMMQDGGATYADKMKVSKNSPKADFIAEKGEYIVNNGIASKLETGGSHASGNDTAISLDKSSNPSYVLSDTPRLKQLQFGGKRVSPSKYAEMATVEALGKTPDQILKAYTAFTKRAGTEGKVFGDRISDATNQLLAQKYQKDLATVKQIADQAYHKQEQLKHAMGMDNDLDHAQEVNGMSMAKSGGMQDGVHMNYFNAPAVQYGGSPQLFSDPSELGYNTTQMAYGGMYRMAGGGNASNTTRQQSQIDYEKQYGVKQNTGDVGVDKYADMQDKSKIGFGNAEQNLKSFSQWKGIYPGYDEIMAEINKPGGPGKDNPKVGNFQRWFNNDYIPQQVKKLNDERVAAGQPAYDATQLNQLKTDLINDFGFDDTTGQRTDSDFGAFTSSRTPLNFSFNRPPADKKEPPVVKGDEPVVPKLTIDKEEEEPYYDFPAINAFIPQPYGRNPIGLAQAQPQTIRPAKLNIQPELNEYNRGIRGAFRGTQGNTSVNVAQQMQGLNNLYGAQNKLYGQKYNFDEQSRMGADQFNAQAIMNTDAGNLQRIGVQQDLINRREGALDTQRRKDFEKGIENTDKQNAYGLSKEYIEDVFAPYINNKGKIDLTQVPRTTTSKDKEKTYTRAEYDKMIAAEKNAALPRRYGGSLKKIKLKLRK
jgi:hypothetical protein